MNNMLKQAHDLGARAALSDLGIINNFNKTAGDLSPLQVGLATGLLPAGGIIGPVVSSLASPQDRALSRFGHTFAGGALGTIGGGALGAGAGYGINGLYNLLKGDDFGDDPGRAMYLGALLGATAGSGVGAGYGQRFSQDRDFGYQVVR